VPVQVPVKASNFISTVSRTTEVGGISNNLHVLQAPKVPGNNANLPLKVEKTPEGSANVKTRLAWLKPKSVPFPSLSVHLAKPKFSFSIIKNV
jgi:hypothetical protein